MIAKYDILEFNIEKRSFDSIKTFSNYIFENSGHKLKSMAEF